MRTKEKYPRVGRAVFIGPYKNFPAGTKIILGKEPLHRRYHEIVFQQGKYYGSVGDMSEHVNNEELFELARKGVVHLFTPGYKPILNLATRN